MLIVSNVFNSYQDRSNCDFICSTASPEDAKHRKTHMGKTALFLAVEKGLLDNTFFLLDNGSSPDSLDKEEDSPLVVGQKAPRSSIGVANEFVNIYLSNPNPFIPTAVRNNHYDMTKLLLNFSARVNQEGAHRRTALHEAARLGLTDFVDLLLKYGAHPDARSSYGLTPLALAAQAGHLEIIRTLLRRGQE